MAQHLPRLLVLLFLGAHVSHGSSLPLTAYDDSMCSEPFRCGGVDIKYPFYLSNATQATPEHTSNFSCGYTDLKIFCLGEGKTETPIIPLGTNNYTILNISYHNSTIILRDADLLRGNDDCPRVSHNVSFGQVWLNYTDSADSLAFFVDCYTKPGDDMPRDLQDYQINCKGFSSPGVSFVFSSEKVDVFEEYELAYHCANYFLAPVHEDDLLRSDPPVLPSQYGVLLRRGFELEWNHSTAQPCHLCEQSAGRCAYSENKEFLGCLCSGGKVDAQDCNSSNATTAYADSPSSGGRTHLEDR